MRTLTFVFLLFSILTATFPLHAQTAKGNPQPASIFDVLTPAEGIALTLETDLITLQEHRKSNEQFAGTLVDSEGHSYEVKLKTRGMFRRMKSDLPPLKIKFRKKDLLAIGLDTLNDISLVLPFKNEKREEELVVREYLAYRMFEQLTPYSIRARLARLTLRDSHTGTQQEMYAILLEDKDALLQRMQGTLVEQFGLTDNDFDSRQLALVAVFQYMIGNTDWELATNRNLRLVHSPRHEKLLAIPYDFDFSGLVNAPYATPSSESGLRSVRERFFMVKNLPETDIQAALDKITSARESFQAICQSPFLSKRACKELTGFLDDFYNNLPTCKEIGCTVNEPGADSLSTFR